MTLIERLKSYGPVVAAVGSGTLIPAVSYFTQVQPPDFPTIAALSSALVGAVVLAASYKREVMDQRAARKRMRVHFALAIGCTLIYWLLLRSTTLVERGQRFQIGFGISQWSLEPYGLDWVKQRPSPPTPMDLMLERNGFAPGGIDRIWKTWSVNTAGVLLAVLMILGVLSWTRAWCLLAKLSPPPADTSSTRDTVTARDPAS